MVMSPAGLGIKNDHAGEGQQQFNRPTDLEIVLLKVRGILTTEVEIY
jgi:hypothetical protein